MNNSDKVFGHLAILLCAVLWSATGLFVKLLDWHPIVISGGRSFLAVFVLFAVRGKREKPTKILPLFIAGFWYAATMILFIIANKLTFSVNAIVLQYTAPVWACFLGWIFLKEKPYWEHWIALCLVCIGMLLVFGNRLEGGSLLGDLLALLTGITFAANSVVLRIFKDGNTLDVMICAQIMCAAFSIPFLFIYTPVFNTGNVLSILFMGIFNIGAASALFVYGIKRVRAVQAMLTASIEPVLNPLWVLLVTGEIPSVFAVFGGIIIIAAVIFSSFVGIKRDISKSA